MRPKRRIAPARALACALVMAVPVGSSGGPLAPFAGPADPADPASAPGQAPSPPWAFVGLPDQKLPATRFVVEQVAGRAVLRVEAPASYGNLVHPLAGVRAGVLSWRWRVERPLPAADLRSRQADDAALKVCVLFDLPREQVPFVERQLLRLAESASRAPLPNATLCYVWEPAWPRQSVVANAYTRRVRWLTLGAPGPQWQTEQRDLAADFLRAFGDESATVPTLRAVLVGADADNTGGHSLGWVGDLQHRAPPAP